MDKVKSYSNLDQSKKLMKILPLETADMYWDLLSKDKYAKVNNIGHCLGRTCVYAWSPAALLEQLPYELCDDDGNSCYLQIYKNDDEYQLEYTDPNGDFESIEIDWYEHFVDACYEMILKLHELNLL